MLTLFRPCCIPLFLYVLLALDNRAGAPWLLGGLGATDWVNGWPARRFDQVSDFGKMFEPTFDCILFVVAIIVDSSAPMWFSVAVLAREVVVVGAVAIGMLTYHMPRLDFTYWGKLATCLLMFAFPGFMLGATDCINPREFDAPIQQVILELTEGGVDYSL